MKKVAEVTQVAEVTEGATGVDGSVRKSYSAANDGENNIKSGAISFDAPHIHS